MKSSNARIVGILLVFLSTGALSAMEPEDGLTTPKDPSPVIESLGLTTNAVEAAVRNAYERTVSFSKGRGDDLVATIDGIVTLESASFDQVRWGDVATFDHLWTIGFQHELITDTLFGSRVLLQPHWRETFPDGATSEMDSYIQQKADASVREVLDEWRALDGGPDPVAVTTFQVVVELEEKTQVYRAGLVWVLDVETGLPRFIPVDFVLEPLHHAIKEPARPAPDGTFFSEYEDRYQSALDRLGYETSSAHEGSQCNYLSELLPPVSYPADSPFPGPWDDAGHVLGQHWTAGGIAASCTCGTDCTQQCQIREFTTICRDQGSFLRFPRYHRTVENEETRAAVRQDGRSAPLECFAAYACGVADCNWALPCGGSIGISFLGNGFNFTPEGVFWDRPLEASFECAPCQGIEDEEEDEDDLPLPDGDRLANLRGCGADFGRLCDDLPDFARLCDKYSCHTEFVWFDLGICGNDIPTTHDSCGGVSGAHAHHLAGFEECGLVGCPQTAIGGSDRDDANDPGGSIDLPGPHADVTISGASYHPSTEGEVWVDERIAYSVSAQDPDLLRGFLIYLDGDLVREEFFSDPAGQGEVSGFIDTSALPAGNHMLVFAAADSHDIAWTPTIAELPFYVDHSQPDEPVTTRHYPEADSWVNHIVPFRQSNFGSRDYLRVRGNGGLGHENRAYLKFDLSDVDGDITQAVLRVRTQDSAIPELTVWKVPNTSWGEYSVTWNTAPTADAVRGETYYSVPYDSWFELDVTDLVTGPGRYTLVLTTDEDQNALDVWSRDSGSFRPRLRVTSR